MALIKDVYSPEFYNSLGKQLTQLIPGFNSKKMKTAMLSNGFDDMEWKERLKHTTQTLNKFLPELFKEAAPLLIRLTEIAEKDTSINAFGYLFIPDYIETYGIGDVKTSAKTLERVTQYISCEFAVRPFIIRYPDIMIPQLLKWAQHKDHRVRRLASEGSRPRLPWGMAFPLYKKDPGPMLPILELLKEDSHEWVRLSVANHLNDISKDNPAVALKLAKQWKGLQTDTDALIKHGLRTLLKQGHPEVLNLYTLDSSHLQIKNLQLHTPVVKIGQALDFTFTIHNNSKKDRTVRIEYAVYYQKAKGHLTKKVYKISERNLKAGEQLSLQRKQSFKIITTRTFHSGLHQLSIILNGKEFDKLGFNLKP